MNRCYIPVGHQFGPIVEKRKQETFTCILTLVDLALMASAYGSEQLHRRMSPL